MSDCKAPLLHVIKTVLIQWSDLTYCMVDNPTYPQREEFIFHETMKNKKQKLSAFKILKSEG